MVDKKISQLPAATSALLADEFPVDQAGTTKKVTLAQVQTVLGTARSVAYVEYLAPIVVTATTSATAQVVVAVPPRTYTGTETIDIAFYSPYTQVPGTSGGTGNYLKCLLFDGETLLGMFTESLANDTAGLHSATYGQIRLTPSAGSHLYSVRTVVSGLSGAVNAGVGGTLITNFLPGYLSITLVNDDPIPAYSALMTALVPTSWWRLGEAGTNLSTAVDAMGVNNATYVGNATGAVVGPAGITGNTAITLAGSTVQAATMAILGSMTLACWLKDSAWANAGLVGQLDNSAQGIGLYSTPTTITLFTGAATSITAPVPSTGVWHLIVGTYDGTNSRIYIDGALTTGPTAKSAAVQNAVPFSMGGYGNTGATDLFTGSMDEVAVWNRAITAGEVASLYGLGSGTWR